MSAARTVVVATGLAILVLTRIAAAQPAHPPSGSGEAAATAAPDSRIPLALEPATRAVLEQTMRGHLQALQAIVAALSHEQYDRASAIAHQELGFPKHHQVMMQEGGATFPRKYQDLAMAHHQAAEDLASVIPTKETKAIFQQLDRTIKACVECHQAYKVE